MRFTFIILVLFIAHAASTHARTDPNNPRYENTLAKDFMMDAPWRVIDAQTSIPVTIIIKDCDTDDVRELHWIRIWDETNGETIIWNHDFNDEEIGDDASEHNFWTYITKVTEGHPALPDGTPMTPLNLGYNSGDDIKLKVSIYYRDDWFNYTETRHLRVHVGDGPFPWPAHWYGGDVHYHTMYTNNLYEYGAPLPAVKETALAMGLHWLTATDHSCDLDETGDGTYSYATQQWEYTLQDAGGTNTHYRDVVAHGSSWNSLGADVAELDCPDFRLYRAVELNVASVDPVSWEKTLHCLVYNTDYIHSPDSGAPGERPVSPDLDGALEQIPGDGFAYSAHPLSDLSGEIMGYDFGVNGSVWGLENTNQALSWEAFRGLQIFNTRSTVTSLNQNNPWSDFDAGNAIDNPYPGELFEGIELWDAILSTGIASGNPRKIFISGGSDAHGDFNYSTHMSIDDFAEDNGIGKVQTVAFVPGDWDTHNLPPMADILAAYRAGKTIVTDGPFLEIGVDSDGDGSWYGPDDLGIGDQGSFSPVTGAMLHLRWASLPEFGEITQIRVLAVDGDGTREISSVNPSGSFGGDTSFPLAGLDFQGWVAFRGELTTTDGLAGHRAFTNPIWINFDVAVGVGVVDRNAPLWNLRNTPNPFNPQTEICYSLSRLTTVTVEIFSSDGQLVRRLVDTVEMAAGYHSVVWDGRAAGGRFLPSGVYLYRVSTGGAELNGKMSLVR